jgi:hypothetical protein
MTRPKQRLPNILVIDVGGTNIKVMGPREVDVTKIPSGFQMTGKKMIREVRGVIGKRKLSAISIGFPGPVAHGMPLREPHNLGRGWVGIDFARAFGCPTKVINDAAMQALGSYEGGRMLFLGLGTGLGSALIIDGVVEPMELAHLPYKKGRTYEDFVGSAGLKRLGKKKWRRHVFKVAKQLQQALQADYVVLGGGNTRLLDKLPREFQRGDNSKSYLGGRRLWETPAYEGTRYRRSSPSVRNSKEH